MTRKERPWYSPNSFTHVPHAEVQVRTIAGEWRTLTEHESLENARTHWQRLCERWPNQECRYVGVDIPFEQYAKVPETIPLGFA